MNPREIKKQANATRRAMAGEAYYDRKYKDLRVADLLLVLEENNYHSEEVVLEALASLNYYKIVEACQLEVAQYKEGKLTDELYKRRLQLIDGINKV